MATAGIVSGVSAQAGAWMGVDYGAHNLQSYAMQGAASLAGGIAGAATRSALTGTSFGDNIMAVLPDVIGSTIGNAVAGEVQAPARLTAQAKAAAAELNPALLDDPQLFAEFRQTYKETRSEIRELSLGDNPYENAEKLADTYEPLLKYAADQEAAGQALAALRTPSGSIFAEAIDGVQLASLGGPITVTGSRYTPSGPALGLKLFDTMAIQAGNLGVKLGNAYGELPLWAQYGVTALGIAADAAGGPLAFAARKAVGPLLDKATDAAARTIGERFLDKGYSPLQAALGGAGALLVGTLVLAGASKARSFLASGGVGRKVERAKATFTRATPVIIDTNKIGYLFGRAGGRPHNVDRTRQNLTEMKRLGVPDGPDGHAMIESHLNRVVQDRSNITSTFTSEWGDYEVRNSLFAGPSGKFALFESTWEVMPDGSRRLTTVIPKGGRK